MTDNISIINFSGAYEFETFYQNRNINIIDCKNINSTKCYCDKEAEKQIKSKISEIKPDGIHFIDSGNYHYVSKFWTDKITKKFDLVVFDHHPDMQPPLFKNLLSCGDWVKEVLDNNRYLNKVILIGIKDSLLKSIKDNPDNVKYQNKVIPFPESQLKKGKIIYFLQNFKIKIPVYISIDKDVLNKEESASDWDNGSMTLTELKAALETILKNNTTIGIDICGDCSNIMQLINNQEIRKSNDNSNYLILKYIYDDISLVE